MFRRCGARTEIQRINLDPRGKLQPDDFMMEKVTLYALSTCSHCTALREYFAAHGVPYTCIDVDLLAGKAKKEMLQEVRKYNRRRSFPTTVIGERVVVGFKEDELREALAL